MTNYHRRFTHRYAQHSAPLRNLLSKDVLFQWGEEQEKTFQVLKRALLSPLLLRFPDSSRPSEAHWTITREDVGCLVHVEVVDVGLSDHHLLQWSVDTTRPDVPAVVELRRSWRRLDIDQFRCMLTSSLCQPDNWPSDLDDMAAM